MSNIDEQNNKVSHYTSSITNALIALSNNAELDLLNRLLGSSAKLHIVGGTIRQLALGATPTDLDLATCFTPQQVSEKLQKNSTIKIIPTGIDHGTLTILINTLSLELTSFRQPGTRLSTNYSQDIYTDLSGRDFTCNALAFDLNTKTLIDPLQGLTHLQSKELRSVGVPTTRFIEDPLRMLRMVRFGPTLGLTVAEDLLETTKKMSTNLSSVSIERIRSEFEKILVGDNIVTSMRMLLNTGLLEQIIPELLPSVNCEQNDFHIHDVFDHTLSVMERTPKELTLRLAALFHDIGKPESLSISDTGRRHFYEHEKFSTKICQSVMERLKFSHAQTEKVALLVRMHMRPLICSDKTVRRLIRDLGPALPEWLELKKADKTPKQSEEDFKIELESFNTKLAKADQALLVSQRSGLAINGKHLIEQLGIKPGRPLGQLLKKLEDAILDSPELNNQSDLIDLAKKLM